MKHKNINCLSHLSFFAIAVFVLALSMQASAGIVGQWLLDETSGTVAKDTSGNGNDGEIIGKPNWVNGKFGKALELDGTYFQGMIDEVAIFDDALGGVEISKIATDGFGGGTPVFPADKLATKWSKIKSSN